MEFKDIIVILEKKYPGVTAYVEKENAKWEQAKKEQK